MMTLDIVIMVVATCWFFWSASHEYDTTGARDAPPRSARRSADGERALHARLAVAGERAVERVGAGLEVHGHLRDAAAGDRLALAEDLAVGALLSAMSCGVEEAFFESISSAPDADRRLR